MNKVIVTGGSGHIGSIVVRLFQSHEYEVHYTGKHDEADVEGYYLGFSLDDVKDFEGVDAVVHLAACADTTVTDENYMMEVNAEASKRLMTRAAKAGVKNIVLASSAALYGDGPCPFKEDAVLRPLNIYASSKLIMERYARTIAAKYPKTNIVALRFSNVYGPNERHKGKTASMIFQLREQMLAGNPRLFWAGNQARDWVSVYDVARACLLASQAEVSDVFNIGYGQAATFNLLVQHWNELLLVDRQVEWVPNPHQGVYQDFTLMDISKAGRGLEWFPRISLAEGMSLLDQELQAR